MVVAASLVFQSLRVFMISLGLLTLATVEAVAFDDPNGFLERLDQELGHQSFVEAFRSGDEFLFERQNCEPISPSCRLTKARYLVQKASSESAEVLTFIGENPHPNRIAKVSRKQWEEISGNRVRDLVREIESYGVRVKVESLSSAIAELPVQGRVVRVPAFEIHFVSETPFRTRTRYQVLVSKSFLGPGQIVRKITDEGAMGKTTLELKEIRGSKSPL